MISKDKSNVKNIIYMTSDGVEVVDAPDYSNNVRSFFDAIPEVGQSLLNGAEESLLKIKELLYSTPAFINLIETCVPENVLQAVLTSEQSRQLNKGVLTLMTKKDGSIMASLKDSSTGKIVSNIPLKDTNITPAISQAITSFAMQMQIAEIAEEIQNVQLAIEEVRKGQENDRIATAQSCQQKLIQAMAIKNSGLKEMALLKLASDAEDSRNLLMQSQMQNISYIAKEPESFWRKVITGEKPEKINTRISEIRDSLEAVSMVSLVEAIAYQEMGESEAATKSLDYYASFIKKTYLDVEGLVERLDSIDPSTQNYWTTMIPNLQEKIMKLTGREEQTMIGGGGNG